MIRVGIAADHGGFALKGQLEDSLRDSGYEVVDFGAHQLNPADDHPDFIVPLAKAVAAGEVERGSRSAEAALAPRSPRTKFPVSAPD